MTDVDVVPVDSPAEPPPALERVTRIGPFAAARHQFVIDSDDEDLAHQLAELLCDLRVEPVDSPEHEPTVLLVAGNGLAWSSHPWGVWRDREPCETTVSDEYVRPYVIWEVVRLVLESGPPCVPVHAAAVAKHGRAVVLAGPSHAGKSTLAGWLTAHGWEFLTDEVALLERRDDGTTFVHPFWRPIGVRRPGPLDALVDLPGTDEEVLVPASRLGRLGSVAPLAAVVFPEYEAGADTTLRPCSAADAVRELAEHLPTLVPDARAVFRAVVAIMGSVPAYSMGVDDLDVAAATLERIVADAS